jgi:hypothetical protein
MSPAALAHAKNPKAELQSSRDSSSAATAFSRISSITIEAPENAMLPISQPTGVARQGKKEVRADSKRIPHVSNSAQVASWYLALLNQFNL